MFADKFLKYNCYHKYKTDYDKYFGEMLGIVLYGLSKYDPTRGASLKTYLGHVCRHRLERISKIDSKFYNKHRLSGDMGEYINLGYSPDFLAQQDELVERIQDSSLPKRTKEIVLFCVSNPDKSQADVAKHLNVSRQAVNQHCLSARQYLKRYNIDF